jgi:hypothetical protein
LATTAIVSHPRELGEELVEQSGVGEEPQARGGILDDEQLVELVTHPLGRHDRETLGHRRDRSPNVIIGLEAVAGDEPRRAQHAQRIIREGLPR